MTIVPANEFSVVVRIDDNLQEYLDLDVSGSTLHIGLERLRRYSNLHFEVDVAMPDIDAVGLSGRARGTIEDFTLDHSLDVRLSGGARLEGIFTASHLDISASGGASADLTGSGESASIDGSGGGRVWLAEWVARTADVSLSGGSRSSVNVTEALMGSVSGGAEVSYSGTPATVDVSRSGGGRVTAQ